MLITGYDTTSIKGDPGAGNTFSINTQPWREYLWNYRGLFYQRGLMINISPPVLNTDNTVVYEFKNNAGTTDTNGKQTAGLWIQPTPGTTEYLSGLGIFDQKESFESITHISTQTPYTLSDGPADKFRSPLTSTGSFVAGSTAPYDEYTLTETNYNQAMQFGTDVENPNAYSFAIPGRSDLQVLAYDLQWGDDSAANYGPFNFSSGDLQTMGAYNNDASLPGVNSAFGTLSYTDSAESYRGPSVISTNVINPDEETLEPVIMNITSSLESVAQQGNNIHVSYTKTFTYFGGR